MTRLQLVLVAVGATLIAAACTLVLGTVALIVFVGLGCFVAAWLLGEVEQL